MELTAIPVEPPVGSTVAELAKRYAVVCIETLTPAAVIQRIQPFFETNIDFNTATYGGIFRDQDARLYESSAVEVFEGKEVTLLGSDAILMMEKAVVRDSLRHIMYWESGSITERYRVDEYLRLKASVQKIRIVDYGIFLIGFSASWRNYAHWLHECLPKLVAFRRLKATWPQLKIVLPAFAPSSFQAQTLAMLALNYNDILTIDHDEALHFRRALIMSNMDIWNVSPFNGTAVRELTANFRPSSDFSNRIFIRRQSGNRRIINFDDLRGTLSAYRFDVVSFEEFSLAEQISCMHGARYVVAEHGAGLANIMFCQPTTSVLELFNPVCVQPEFWSVASAFKLKFGYLVGEHDASAAGGSPDWNSDYFVPPSTFECALRSMLGTPRDTSDKHLSQTSAVLPGATSLAVRDALATFGRESLDSVSTFSELIEAVFQPTGRDCIYRHAADTPLNTVERGMVENQNLFGPGKPNPMFLTTKAWMHGVSTAALHNVIISGQATTVHSVTRGFYEPTLRAHAAPPGLESIAEMEPFYISHGAAGLAMKNPMDLPFDDSVAVPLCGMGLFNYGHFLFDGLPFAFQLKRLLGDKPFKLVSNRLQLWQRDILGALGLIDRHFEVTQPVRFSQALVTDMVSEHVSYPTRFIRPVFDALRFAYGGAVPRAGKVVLFSRAFDVDKRPLLNRAEMERALEQAGVDIVQPENLSLADQIATAAAAQLIIGEAGAGMANIGFCDPGASVLEIQNEDVPDGWTRGTCRMMGLRWHLYVGQSAGRANSKARSQGFGYPFTVDIASLLDAVKTIRTQLE